MAGLVKTAFHSNSSDMLLCCCQPHYDNQTTDLINDWLFECLIVHSIIKGYNRLFINQGVFDMTCARFAFNMEM